MTRPGSVIPVSDAEIDYPTDDEHGDRDYQLRFGASVATVFGPIPGACEPTRVGYPPPAHLPTPRATLPDLDTCGHDEVIDLAFNALHNDDDLWTLSGSRLHIRAICQQVERIDLDLMAAQDTVSQQGRVIIHQQVELAAQRQQIADLELMLRTERARLEREACTHHETMNRLFAQTAENLRQTRTVDQLLAEQKTLKAEISTKDRQLLAGRRAPQVFDVSDETDVVDMDGHDEPAVSRTVTPRVHVPMMREMVGGGS